MMDDGDEYRKEGRETEDENTELFGLSDGSTSSKLLVVLFQRASPVAASFLLTTSGNFINLAFAGQYILSNGEKSAVFAGVSLATMFANMSCRSVLLGMTAAVETLGSQNNGAGNYEEVGILLQRSCLVLLIMTIPISWSWFYAYDFFRNWLGVEAAVCEVLQRYLYIRMLAIPMDAFMFSYEKYLMSMGIFTPSTWANLVFVVFLFLSDLFAVNIFHFHYDFLSWTWTISLWISGILQVVLSLPYLEVQRTLVKPYFQIHPSAWTEWKEFIRLGVPGTIMLCGEWWAYEILSIFAAFLQDSTTAVSVQGINIQIACLMFMIPFGIGISTTTLLGNAIGAEMFVLASKLIILSLICISLVECCMGIIISHLGKYFVSIFTTDEAVLSAANLCMNSLAILCMMDGVQCVIGCILRASGKQFTGAVGNMMAFYVIGLPLAWICCFHLQWNVPGLLLGLAVGVCSQWIYTLPLVCCNQESLFSTSTILQRKRREGFQIIGAEEDENEGV
jgi:MATE family multidrug resistance protein